jgi:hypothetical protein
MVRLSDFRSDERFTDANRSFNGDESFLPEEDPDMMEDRWSIKSNL